MQPRISNPATSVPGVLDALQALSKAANEATSQAGLPKTTVDLVSLCASQINAWNRLHVITGQVAGEWTAQWTS